MERPVTPSKRMQLAFVLTLITVLLTLYAHTDSAGASGGRVLGFSTMSDAMAALQLPLATIVIFGLGLSELRRGWDSLRRGILDHHTVGLIAVALAYTYSHLLLIDARLVSGFAMVRPHSSVLFPLFDAISILVTGLMWISLTQDRVRAEGQQAIDALVARAGASQEDHLRRILQSAFFSEIPALAQRSNQRMTLFTRIALVLAVATGIAWWTNATGPAMPTAIVAMIAVLVVAFPAAARLSSTLPLQTAFTNASKMGAVIKSASVLASLAVADRFLVQDASFNDWTAALEKAGLAPVEPDEDPVAQVAALTAEGHQVVVLGSFVGAPLHPGVVVVSQQLGEDAAIFAPDLVLLDSDENPASAERLIELRKLAETTTGRIRRGLAWTNAYHAVGLVLACGLIAPLVDWTMAPWLAALASLAFARVILPPATPSANPQPAQ
jgi:cation transport ATPase